MERLGRRKTAYINGTLIILNILYFIFLELTGSSNNPSFMIQKGAMYTPLVIEGGEYYRLLTSVFMHFGIEHLVNNMLILFVLGDNLERALGKVKYLILYLFCGVGANVISMLAGMKDYGNTVGAGASGAIFGVIGALIVVVGKNRGRLEDLSSRQLVIAALFSLYFGFTSTGVDNTAHVAGLVLGMILAFILYRSPRRVRTQGSWDNRNRQEDHNET